jgi:hypothetical protein
MPESGIERENMVTTGQITGMLMAMLLPTAVAAVFFTVFYRHSRKIETGMAGAFGYGFAGYLWQELIYLLAIVGLCNVETIRTVMESYYIITAGIYSIFVAVGLYWGIYLTNQKQKSVYRSLTVGVGFGFGNVVWNLFAAYGMSFYYALQMKYGTFTGSAEIKESILAAPTATMYLDALKCILFLVIYVGIAFVMSKFYLAGKRPQALAAPAIIQLFISLFNTVLSRFLSKTAAQIGIYAILVLLSAVTLYVLYRWMKKESSASPQQPL